MFDVGYRMWNVINGFAMNSKYELTAPFIERLDDLSMEEVCDVLEVEAPKYGINSVNWKEQFPYHPITVFSIAHSRRYIYVNYFVRCNYLKAVYYKNNAKVCEDSCVEFFLQLPESPEYWNFEFNCIGAVCASHREERHSPTRLTDAEIAKIKRYASCGGNPFQELEGLFNWNVAIAIPFDLIGLDFAKLPVTIKGNFYKCASGTSMPHFLSWAPILTEKPDFHTPQFFGNIVLL